MVESTGLENRRVFGYRGFESHSVCFFSCLLFVLRDFVPPLFSALDIKQTLLQGETIMDELLFAIAVQVILAQSVQFGEQHHVHQVYLLVIRTIRADVAALLDFFTLRGLLLRHFPWFLQLRVEKD